jgi:hypothetical protein
MKYFIGKDGCTYGIGVVENRQDPLMLGRAKVRYFGIHPEDKTKVPTKDLPWSHPMISLDPGKAHVTGPKEGDWVFAIFLDGEQAQFPVMMGILPGYAEKVANASLGFNDPRTVAELANAPREPESTQQFADGSGNTHIDFSSKNPYPDQRYLKEADTNRYERNEFIDKTIVPLKRINVSIGQTNVPTAGHPIGTGTDEASVSGTWTELETPYNARYPYNHVYFSESGHIIEIDDTPGAERLHQYHRTGTFSEIHPDGSQVTKIVNDEYHIVLKNRNTHIENNDSLTVDKALKVYANADGESHCFDLTVGSGGNINFTTADGKLNIYVNGDTNFYTSKDCYLRVDKNLYANVEKDANVHIVGNTYLQLDGDLNAQIVGSANLEVQEDLKLKVGGNYIKEIEGDMIEHVKNRKHVKVKEEYVKEAATISNRAKNIANVAETGILDQANTIDHVSSVGTHNVGGITRVNALSVVGPHEGPVESETSGPIPVQTVSDEGSAVNPEAIEPPEEVIDAPVASGTPTAVAPSSAATSTATDFYDNTKASEPNGPVEPAEIVKK